MPSGQKTSCFLLHLVSQTSKALYYIDVSSCCVLGFPGITSDPSPFVTCDAIVTPGVTTRHWSMQQNVTALWPDGATYFDSYYLACYLTLGPVYTWYEPLLIKRFSGAIATNYNTKWVELDPDGFGPGLG